MVGQASFPPMERPQGPGGTGDRAILPYTVTATDEKGLGWLVHHNGRFGVWEDGNFVPDPDQGCYRPGG